MPRTRTRTLRAVSAALLGTVTAVTATGATPAAAAIGPSFVDNFDGFATGRWHKADGYSNGGMFNAGWRADHVWFSGGVMGINLDTDACPGGCSGKPYAAGEYRTNDLYSYGRFEARLKAVRNPGTVTSFFTYTGPSDGQPWDEIDMEILGKNTRQLQTNYFTNGAGGHEKIINLGFDAADGYHDYAFEWWNGGTINWFVDGALVHQENGSRGPLPTRPQRIMMNLWPGVGVDSWLQPFTYPGHQADGRLRPRPVHQVLTAAVGDRGAARQVAATRIVSRLGSVGGSTGDGQEAARDDLAAAAGAIPVRSPAATVTTTAAVPVPALIGAGPRRSSGTGSGPAPCRPRPPRTGSRGCRS